MEMLKRFEPLWLFLVVCGGLNWAIVGLFDTNVIADIFGSGTLTDVVYAIVGFAALMMIPSLMARMHMGDHMHPRGA
jgi:uncharacterized membrane protein YuzA (DUF378 family)